jgi:hypothetical protein
MMATTEEILRVMAWERAKGELESISTALTNDLYGEYENLKDKFIRDIEDEGIMDI